MELKMEIGLDQLMLAIKRLPAKQLVKLKAEINKVVPQKTDNEDFQAFLLQAPIFSEDDIARIEDVRKSLNKWGNN